MSADYRTAVRPAKASAATARRLRAIAHDFNNILTTIVGNARFIAESETGSAHADAEEILAAAERARALTSELQALGVSDRD